MCIPLSFPVTARWLAARLGLEYAGPDREVARLCSLGCLAPDGLAFALPGVAIEGARHGTLVALPDAASGGAAVLPSAKPRLDFIRAQYVLDEDVGFVRDTSPPNIHPSARIGRGAIVEEGVSIGPGTIVGCNAVILSGTRIGAHCEIQSGAVIGDAGFGFERDIEHRPLRMIHLGGVRIGDHVEIGVHACVARGALGDTVLEDYVKVNNLVHIAHNCRIGQGTIIGACADLCGSITVGRDCWIAPNTSIRQKLHVGDEAIVGIGAVVVKDVEARTTVYGNPAVPQREGAQSRRLRDRPLPPLRFRPVPSAGPRQAASSAAAD